MYRVIFELDFFVERYQLTLTHKFYPQSFNYKNYPDASRLIPFPKSYNKQTCKMNLLGLQPEP